GGDGEPPSNGGTPTRRCRCAACRRARWRPSTATCGTRSSDQCPRRGGAIRRAVLARTGSRRGFPAAQRSRRAGGWPALRWRSLAALGRVRDRRDDDVGQGVVHPAGHHFAPRPPACGDTGRLEDAQVLADQGLRHRQRVDEFMHTARRLTQLQHDRDPNRRGQRTKQVACGVEHVARRELRQWGATVVVHLGTGQSGNRFHYGPRIHARPRMSTLPGLSLGCSPVASIIDTVANLAKRRGLVFQSGEIYGGTKSAWDFGPLGVELKENIKRQWWRSVVTSRDDVVGLDSAIILPREVWVASGHVEVFHDPLVE